MNSRPLSNKPYDLPCAVILDHQQTILHNQEGTVAVPVIRGIPYFTESDFFAPPLMRTRCQQLLSATQSQLPAYEKFVRQKSRRPSYDIYACFQSFNEAFKAFYPFISLLREELLPGQIILNLWDRTGWVAALLQGFFPEQRVISLWEGDRDVLGYKGFQFWYAGQVANQDLAVAFADPNKRLPFPDNSVRLVFGLDAFHRFDQSHLLREVLRITPDDGAVFFPHVHLSNAEPEPFFERGCRQLHGLSYDAWFRHLLEHSSRQGFVFPEPELFARNELYQRQSYPLTSTPDTSHYNALLAILPHAWADKHQMVPFRFDDLSTPEQCFVLINPLLHFDASQQTFTIDRHKFADRVGYLLDRHPIYQQKLARADGHQVSEMATKALYLAQHLYTVAEMAEALNVTHAQLLPELRDLQERDILQLVPVTRDQIRLQHFLTSQQYVLPPEEQTLQALWRRAVRQYGNRPFLISELDDSIFHFSDADTLIATIAHRLQQEGLRAGDRVVLLSANHFEAILTILATVQLGAIAVPLEYKLSLDQARRMIGEAKPSLIFVDSTAAHTYASLLAKAHLITFDGTAEPDVPCRLFSDWVTEATPLRNWPDPKANDPAVILYTSGSTGQPKGVVLTHGQLVRSSRLITESFHWTDADRFLAVGELDSMSGLRNACFAPLESGTAVIIPEPASKQNALEIAACAGRYQATLLGTTPALLAQWVHVARRVRPDLHTLRQIICTGSALPDHLKKAVIDHFDLEVFNYYGLTETTGICLSETPDSTSTDQSTLGIPRDAILQVVDEQGSPVPAGQEGELRIFSANVMTGYYQNEALTQKVIRNGWFYTGDLARIHPDGTIDLLGRKRDVIKTADGLIVYTSEVEGYLSAHPMVREVTVVPRVTEAREYMEAYVVPNSAPPELNASLTELLQQKLQHRKVTVKIHLRSELPRNASGKVLKQALQ